MSERDACLRAEQVRRLVDGELAAGELDTLQRHLGECGHCREDHAALTRLSALLREGDSAPRPDADRQARRRAALLAACAATLPAAAPVAPARPWTRWRKPLAWVLVPTAAGALLLALNRPAAPPRTAVPSTGREALLRQESPPPAGPAVSQQNPPPGAVQPDRGRPVTSGPLARRPSRPSAGSGERRGVRRSPATAASQRDRSLVPAPRSRPRRDADPRWLELPTDRVVIHADRSRPLPEPDRESVSITAVGDPSSDQGSYVIIRSREKEKR